MSRTLTPKRGMIVRKVEARGSLWDPYGIITKVKRNGTVEILWETGRRGTVARTRLNPTHHIHLNPSPRRPTDKSRFIRLKQAAGLTERKGV